MSYNLELEKRITKILKAKRKIEIKNMFGGICFMHNGNMLCGIDKNKLMVRVGPEQYESVLKMKYAKVMDITGKPMKGFIFVNEDGFKSETNLKKWIQLGLNFTEGLPHKKPKAKSSKAKTNSTPIRQARNIGKVSSEELKSIGISTLGQLRSKGWEVVFEQLVQAYPNRLNLNMATSLIGAVEDFDWKRIPKDLKHDAKLLIRDIKARFR